MRLGERHRLLHLPHHPSPAPLSPSIPLYNIPKPGSHLTRQRAHLGNAGYRAFDGTLEKIAKQLRRTKREMREDKGERWKK